MDRQHKTLFGKAAILISVGIALGLFFSQLFSTDMNKHKFKLDYSSKARLVFKCHNCYYFFQHYDYDSGGITIVDSQIGITALKLFSDIRFCGLGDTTPDGMLTVTTDSGDHISIGLILPQSDESDLRMHSQQTGFGWGCTKTDQRKFEQFFRENIHSKFNQREH